MTGFYSPANRIKSKYVLPEVKTLLSALLFVTALEGRTAPSFEAASIKPNRSGSGNSSTRQTKGLLRAENISLRRLIMMANSIPEDREYALIGPSWMASDRYDIVARFAGEATGAQYREMLRNLLAERFKLELRSETRPMPTYSLVVAKGGHKMKADEGTNSRTSGRSGHLEATCVSMPKFADLLARSTGMPVKDETGLAGAFTFVLDWSPDETSRIPAASAVQEQLGLRLEGKKAAIEVLMVDRIERTPVEN